MIAGIIQFLLGLGANVLALVAAFDNPTFDEVGRGLSVVSFILRTLLLL